MKNSYIHSVQQLQPLGVLCLVEMLSEEAVTESGIVLPEVMLERDQLSTQEGILISKGATAFNGRDYQKDAETMQPGDKVLCVRYAGNMYKFCDKNYRIMHDSDILTKINEPQGE